MKIKENKKSLFPFQRRILIESKQKKHKDSLVLMKFEQVFDCFMRIMQLVTACDLWIQLKELAWNWL